MSVGILSKLILVRDVPAWLALRNVLGEDGKPHSKSTVYGWIQDGRLKAVLGLPRMHIREDDLERFLGIRPEETPVRKTKHRESKLRRRGGEDEADKILREFGVI